MAYIPSFYLIMETYTLQSTSLTETQNFGNLLGRHARAGFVYCLDGDLGAGKTTLTQAIAQGLNLTDGEYISSPSFAIMHEYHGEIPLYHMDFYRLHSSDDVLALGFDEYFYKKGLTVIEWSKRATDILPDDRLTINIQLEDDKTRIIKLQASSIYHSLLKKISNTFPPNNRKH